MGATANDIETRRDTDYWYDLARREMAAAQELERERQRIEGRHKRIHVSVLRETGTVDEDGAPRKRRLYAIQCTSPTCSMHGLPSERQWRETQGAAMQDWLVVHPEQDITRTLGLTTEDFGGRAA